MCQSRPLFVYFRPFHFQHQLYKLNKAQMVCLGFESGATGWQVQTKPRSYGGRPTNEIFQLKSGATFRANELANIKNFVLKKSVRWESESAIRRGKFREGISHISGKIIKKLFKRRRRLQSFSAILAFCKLRIEEQT